MAKYLLKRILVALVTLIGITVIDYWLMNLAGDPVKMMAGPKANAAALALKAENMNSLILKGHLRLSWSVNAGINTICSWPIWILMMGERLSHLRGRIQIIWALRICLSIPG